MYINKYKTNYNSNIKYYWSQVTIANIILMKELGVLYVSQKHEARNYWKTGADRLAYIGLWQTLNLQKITVSIKCNKEKHNKMKYVCINIMYFSCKYLLAFILRILLEKGKKEMTEDWLVTF